MAFTQILVGIGRCRINIKYKQTAPNHSLAVGTAAKNYIENQMALIRFSIVIFALIYLGTIPVHAKSKQISHL